MAVITNPIETASNNKHFFDVYIVKSARTVAESPLTESDINQLKRACTFIKQRTESIQTYCAVFTFLVPIVMTWLLQSWDHFGLAMTAGFLGFIGLCKLTNYLNLQHYIASVRIDNEEFIEPLNTSSFNRIEFEHLKSIVCSNLAYKYVENVGKLKRPALMIDEAIVKELNKL